METFISYSHLDKELAGSVKRELESCCGFKVFLAHEDIQPSYEWIDEILKQLIACHIFIPILTENFVKSNWTDQEVGIAIAGNKLIIPFKFSIDPHGFMSRYQALAIHDSTEMHISNACNQVEQIIVTNPAVGDLFRDEIIKRFGSSNSFAEAVAEAKRLLRYEDFYTTDQVAAIIKHVVDNDQIYRSWYAHPMLRRLVDKYKDRIDTALYSDFYRALR